MGAVFRLLFFVFLLTVTVLQDGWNFLNHGAFGGALRAGIKASQQWQEYAEVRTQDMWPTFFLRWRFFDWPVSPISVIWLAIFCSRRG